MTNIIKQAAHVAADISRKEAEISEFRANQFVEEDKFTLIGILAVEAARQNFRPNSKKAGQFLASVCFDVLGQKNKTGKGKKLAENARKLAKHPEFLSTINVARDGGYSDNLTAGKFRDKINQRCEELQINSFNKLVAFLNPKEELSDEEQIVALAQKIAKANGHDVDTVEGKTAVWELVMNAADLAKIGSGYDDNVTVLKQAV